MPISLPINLDTLRSFKLRSCSLHLWLILTAVLGVGCSSRIELPDLGPQLPLTATLEVSPSLTEAKANYTDNCGHLQILEFGGTFDDVVTETAHRMFKAIVRPGSDAKPDVMVRLKLVQSSFILRMDNVYDRAPVELVLGVLVSYLDPSGKLLGEEEIRLIKQEKVRIQPVQKNCDYLLDVFVHNAAVEFATKFDQTTRARLDPAYAQSGTSTQMASRQASPRVTDQPNGPDPVATIQPSTARVVGSPISFKATVLDENSNLILEGGEQIRVRIDLVNTGDQELRSVAATLTGTPALIAQFPTTTLSAGKLQSGQSRTLEFVATLPQSVQPQKAELQVAVLDPAIAAPPLQRLSLSIQPAGAKADDIDHVPAAAGGFKRPHMYLLSIGISSYRDPQLSLRKYAASDAELLTSYFQSLGGLPASNVRLLQDWKALRPDIDEALLDWLPGHMHKDAVVIVYFAGLSTVTPNGDVYLVPYDGNNTGVSRSYPLKDLESALGRLKAKQTVFIFDGAIMRLGGDSRSKAVLPQWNPSGGSTVHVIATNGMGKVVEDDDHRHGLFTYYLLRALRGESDLNRDGEVTLGETISYLSQKVSYASRTQYGQEQRPAVWPPLKSTDPASTLALSRLAAIRAAENQ